MYSSDLESVEWYVIFSPAKIDHWIYRFVDRSLGHVMAVRSLNDYYWLMVQPRFNMVEVRTVLKCQYPHVRLIAGPDAKIVKVKVMPNSDYCGGLTWFSCVEQVKVLLGIRSIFTLTPRQLYNGLIGGRYVRRRQ